eukprot:gene60-38_t
MPPKRPEPLGRIAVDPKKEAVSITDTLTLVVKGEGGLEMRVKESGIDQRHTTAPAVPSPAADGGSISNKLKFDDLRIGGELGKGSQGKVRVVQHRVTNEKFALKYISFESNSDDIILPLSAELRRVAAVKHQNLVSSYEAFSGKFTEPILAYIARELFQGLAYLHNFGVAKTFVGGDLKTLSSQGSVPYMSPERIKSEPYSFDCDLNKNIFELCHDISSGAAKINWDQPGLNFSAECKDFIESCLKPEAERPSAAQQLQHPFLEKAKGLDPMEVGKWFMG